MERIIEIKNLVFGYENSRNKPLLCGIELTVNQGDKIAILGPNGSGKTTLLYLIMGFLKPKEGEIKIFGKLRKEEKDFAEVRAKIGLLFQNSDAQLICPTVKEDIAFGLLNMGKSKKETMETIKKIAEYFEITHLLERSIFKLSGGEKKLVALAGVFAMNPVCYLLDEPTSGLDEKSKSKVLKILENVNTWIMVTHEEKILKNLTNKVYLLENGKLNPIRL